jgi:hypothetical protein
MTIPELAERAYVEYGSAVHWRNHRGEGMPLWPALPGPQRDAWCAAAEAIVTAIREDAEAQMPSDPMIIMTSRDNAAAVFRALAEQRGEPDV